MRILYLNHNVAWQGGTFYRAYHIARHLARRGHSVTLLSIAPKERWVFHSEKREGVEIVLTPDLTWGLARTGWDPWDTLRRVVFLGRGEWDIIHAWDCRPAVILPALFAHAMRRSRSPLFIDWCDWWGRGGTQAERPGKLVKAIYGPIETFFEEAFRTFATGTTLASNALRDRAIRLGVSRDNMMMLPGGCDTEQIRPLDMLSARQHLGLPHDRYVVGYMGALTLSEMDLLTKAIGLARERIPHLCLLAIGIRIVGAGAGQMESIKRSWPEWIIDVGRIPIDKISIHLGACNLLLLPMRQTVSNVGRWPSKVNDYLAAGRPVLATRVGEIVPLFDRPIGRLTDDTAGAFSEGIIAMALNSSLSVDCGHEARLMAEGSLNWSELVERLESFYVSMGVRRKEN